MRLASLVTAINVLVASGFAIAAIVRPQYLVPAGAVPTEASLIFACTQRRAQYPWLCSPWGRSTNARRLRY
jgi:hypothetical protein